MVSDYLKILSNQNRGRILMILMHCPLNAKELSEILEIEQTNLSKHLKLLLSAEIIDYVNYGKYKYYFINQQLDQENNYITAILLAYKNECIAQHKHFRLFNLLSTSQIDDRIKQIQSQHTTTLRFISVI